MVSEQSQVLVWCDHDALYSAIELKLGSLPRVCVLRLAPTFDPLPAPLPWHHSAMMILATIAPAADPRSLLAQVPWRGEVQDMPVLVISERPSRAESEDKITYLNFPFDLDELTTTVQGILDRHAPNGVQGAS